MTLDFSDPRFWLDAAQTLVILGLFLRKPGVDAGAALAALAGRVDVIEAQLKHMPNSDELTELEGTVKAVHAQLIALKERMELTGDALVRIEIFLRENR